MQNRRDLRDRLYLGHLNEVPTQASLERYVTEVLDQKSTNAGVAHSVAHAISIMEKHRGYEYGTPSRLFLYWNARMQHGKSVTDDGTYIRSCMKGLRENGVPDEKYWPFNIRKVNQKPSGFSPWVRANARKEGEYLAILGTSSMRLHAIRDAVAGGFPVVFCTALETSFLSALGPWEIDKPKSKDPIVGYHAMCIVGYDGDRFRVLNSWGGNWRDNGFCWMSGDYIKWSESRDFTVIKDWKRLRKGN